MIIRNDASKLYLFGIGDRRPMTETRFFLENDHSSITGEKVDIHIKIIKL